MFDLRKVNSYSADELFEFIERGVVNLEELKKFGLYEPLLLELEKRVSDFRKIKELDDWKSVKDSGLDGLELFISKYKFSREFYCQAYDRTSVLNLLTNVENEIERINWFLTHDFKFKLVEIERFLKILLCQSSPQERERIQRDFRDLYRLFQFFENSDGVLDSLTEGCCMSNASSCDEDVESLETLSTHWSNFDVPKLSYTPQRLLDSCKLDFCNKEKTLCNSAVFAPSEIAKGDDLFVQVYIYKDEETNKVIVDSRTSDNNATQRSYIPLNFPIKSGDKISVRLDMHGLSVEGTTTKSIIWQNKYTKCGFFVHVPINYGERKVKGDVYLSVNGIELGQMSFFSTIERSTDSFHSAQVETKIYKKVFISYSHKDDATVQSIAEAYKALETVDYFYDRHTLSPGELFEQKIFEYIDQCDLFVLCWSKNAEESEWVKKERKRAYYRAIDSPPKLRLYPINIPPYAAPPSEFANKMHFNDYDKLIASPESQIEKIE